MSNIEWTDVSWNPVRGCSRVSKGCENCYAERQAIRHAGPGGAYEGLVKTVNGHPVWTGAVRCVPAMLEKPQHWRNPRMIFVNSMSDLFHPSVPFDFIDRVMAVMASCPQHTFQILTKRPARMLEYFLGGDAPCGINGREELIRVALTTSHAPPGKWCSSIAWPLPNVWLIVSVEDQDTANERLPLLEQTPAAVRGVSCEPLLSHVDLGPWLGGYATPFIEQALAALDWVIVGGESGPGARPCRVEWIRDVRQQCQDAGVACFIKQMGAQPVADQPETMMDWAKHARFIGRGDGLANVKLQSRKGGDMSEWPKDLRVRQYPVGEIWKFTMLLESWLAMLKEIHDVVRELVGDVKPIGETRADENRLENLKILCDLTEELIMDINDVYMGDENSSEDSRKKAAKYAGEFFDRNEIAK